MTRQPVASSAIKSIGHEGDILEVELQSGKVYQYAGVTRDRFEQLRSAESIGTHFGKHIRGKFDHTLIEPEAETGAQG